MRNKIELLRSIQYTIIDLEAISNLDEVAVFTDKDKEFMEAFKKIYEFGLKQLEFFINKLDEEGKDLDIYSIQYYIRVLLNGPLGQFARELAKDKLYFVNAPDVLGILGNKLRSYQNTTVLIGLDMPLGASVDTFNKLPGFLQESLANSVEQAENVFRSSLNSSIIHDNTLPIVDKRNQQRYDEEPTGQWVTRPNGNYLVKDSIYYRIISNISSDVYQLIKDYLGEENFRLFTDNKSYNSFDSDDNTSTSRFFTLERTLTQGEDTTQKVDTDLFGNMIDSIERRESTIKVENGVENKEFKLSTNTGQLGN